MLLFNIALAALWKSQEPNELVGYTHGDLQSREVRLAERVCRTAGIDFHAEPLTNEIYRLETLKRGFCRTENVVFPHWHRAGAVLAAGGVGSTCAGIFGEVLGGHYGSAMLMGGLRKVATVGGALLRMSPSSDEPGPVSSRGTYDLLRLKTVAKPWYINAAFWHELSDIAARINADIKNDITRLEVRGVKTREGLVEGFLAEHRGAQYIGSQLLSCRANLDIAIPFADRDLLLVASRIPLHEKIHNLVNQSMLRNHAPELLRLPLAATLVRAGAPVFLQEASRLVRRVGEDLHWRLHFNTRGRIGPPRLAWVNVEFLRHRQMLDVIADDLQSDMWDKEAIRGCLKAAAAGRPAMPMHPISDAMLRVYSVDLMVRADTDPVRS